MKIYENIFVVNITETITESVQGEIVCEDIVGEKVQKNVDGSKGRLFAVDISAMTLPLICETENFLSIPSRFAIIERNQIIKLKVATVETSTYDLMKQNSGWPHLAWLLLWMIKLFLRKTFGEKRQQKNHELRPIKPSRRHERKPNPWREVGVTATVDETSIDLFKDIYT
eukprot:snap_masked-scaffold_14-processed-gene-9.11-mRNA-1 protein AED:1.00 eAED:1.00 QI:0/-1/0/0/-1/1/1/0/169